MKSLLALGCLLMLSDFSHAADINFPARTNDVLRKVFEAIKEHHPGMLDQNNPHFFQDLQRDYDAALVKAQYAQSPEHFIEILEGFANSDFRKTRWRRLGAPAGVLQPAAKARLEIRSDVIEAHFPSFRTGTDEEKQAMNNVLAELTRLLKEPHNKTLIINFKGNNDVGNSTWGDEIFKAVWGLRTYEIIKSQLPLTLYYRITAENNNYMKGILSYPMPDEYKKIFAEISQKMAEALEQNVGLIKYQQETNIIDEKLLTLSFPVLVSTDGQVSKAVRPFLPFALKAGAKFVGAPIPACSPYAELREIAIYEDYMLVLPIAACFEDSGAYETNY